MALARLKTIQLWTAKIPFQPKARAAYTWTTGSGVVRGSGASPALSQRVSLQRKTTWSPASA